MHDASHIRVSRCVAIGDQSGNTRGLAPLEVGAARIEKGFDALARRQEPKPSKEWQRRYFALATESAKGFVERYAHVVRGHVADIRHGDLQETAIENEVDDYFGPIAAVRCLESGSVWSGSSTGHGRR